MRTPTSTIGREAWNRLKTHQREWQRVNGWLLPSAWHGDKAPRLYRSAPSMRKRTPPPIVGDSGAKRRQRWLREPSSWALLRKVEPKKKPEARA